MRQQLQNSENKLSKKNNLWEGEYQVSQISYFNDEIKDSYQKKIHLLLETTQDSNFHFQYSEFDFRKNDETSDTKASTLSQLCVEVIYPIKFIVDIHGGLQNVELIKSVSQTQSELENVKHYFVDEFSSEYVDKMKKLIESPKIVFDKFKNTLVNSFLFNTVYSKKLSTTEENFIYTEFYPWINDANPILFEIHNSILNTQNSEQEFIHIKQKGICADYRSYEELYYKEFDNNDFFMNDNSIDCEFNAEYVINKENKSLKRIEATFENFVQNNIEKETSLLERLE